MLKADSFILQNALPEHGGKLILILVSLALDRVHQIADAMGFRIDDFADVLSLEKAVTFRADGVAVQITKGLRGPRRHSSHPQP